MHDPEAAELRLEASRKGGHARSNAARAAKAVQPALTTDDLLMTLSACDLTAAGAAPRSADAAD
jgi:hypothetical protein